MVDKQFAAKKGAKANRRRSLSSSKAKCDKIAHNCLAGGNNPTKKWEDHSSTMVLKWWKDNEPVHAEIADMARHRSCAQASSATLKHAFSKARLIMSKKRQWHTANDVDSINLMG